MRQLRKPTSNYCDVDITSITTRLRLCIQDECKLNCSVKYCSLFFLVDKSDSAFLVSFAFQNFQTLHDRFRCVFLSRDGACI